MTIRGWYLEQRKKLSLIEFNIISIDIGSDDIYCSFVFMDSYSLEVELAIADIVGNI